MHPLHHNADIFMYDFNLVIKIKSAYNYKRNILGYNIE